MIERIVELLNNRGIKAAHLMSDLGLSNSAVSGWKKGKAKPSHDAIVKIAAYFGVSTDYLLGVTDNPTPANLETPYISPEDYDLFTKVRDLPPEKRKAIETLINN